MNKFAYISVLLFGICFFPASIYAQEKSENTATDQIAENEASAVGEDQAEVTAAPAPLSFDSAKALATHIEEKIAEYRIAIGAQAGDPALSEVLQKANPDELAIRAMELKDILSDSTKVRLFVVGYEEVDNESTPACGFACVAIAKESYNGTPKAEALLYNSPDANILLVHAVLHNEQPVGVLVVHYPYSLIKDSLKALKNIGLYTEFRQTVAGKPTAMLSHGNKTVKTGSARKTIRIEGTSWNIAVWTPGGVEVEKYEPPSIPWFHIGLGVVILIGGIVLLIIVRKKRPAKIKELKPSSKPEVVNAEAAFYDDEDGEESKTLIMGGGASEVDVSEYLKSSGVKTNIKKKP